MPSRETCQRVDLGADGTGEVIVDDTYQAGIADASLHDLTGKVETMVKVHPDVILMAAEFLSSVTRHGGDEDAAIEEMIPRWRDQGRDVDRLVPQVQDHLEMMFELYVRNWGGLGTANSIAPN